ncbi:MAG TPA: MerR family transcriptional regulator [Acidobacteriaceae bacterium]|nr:MerR family transcriptional regulator [Acidobacteriaceae bacterium]
MSSLTVGWLAKNAGVNPETVRYYERQGLVSPAARTEAGYRIYQQESVRRIRFIKRAQELGFSLNEIKELLSLRVDADATASDVRVRALARLVSVEEKIRHLQDIQQSLTQLIESCHGGGPASECPILENLDGKVFQ